MKYMGLSAGAYKPESNTYYNMCLQSKYLQIII